MDIETLGVVNKKLASYKAESATITILDPAIFTQSLVIGGGGKHISRTGVNPVDPLSFEANGSFNGILNTFYGIGTGGANTTGNGNTFVGSIAGQSNINGDQNTFVGWAAGQLNTNGYHNTFLGVGAGQNNTTGYFNTFIGCDCGLQHKTGVNNVAIGASTFGSNTTGSLNVALGSGALALNIVGNQNIAIGSYSCAAIINSSNTGIGYCSLGRAAGVSHDNVGIGQFAGYTLTLGIGNTFIGPSAGYNASQAVEVSNSTAIGQGAYTTATNTMQLGNVDVTKVYSHGDFEAQDIGDGFICKSPDGTRYRITVANGGTVAVAAA